MRPLNGIHDHTHPLAHPSRLSTYILVGSPLGFLLLANAHSKGKRKRKRV